MPLVDQRAHLRASPALLPSTRGRCTQASPTSLWLVSTISCTRPTAPVWSRTLMPREWKADSVRVSFTTPLPLHLGQRYLRLRQPERHPHRLVHLHSRGECGTSLVALAGHA